MSCPAVAKMLGALGQLDSSTAAHSDTVPSWEQLSADIERELEMSADRKTAARVVVRGSKAYADKNALGLTAGRAGSCGNWITEFCDKCYAQNTETQWSAVAALVARNLAALRAVDGCHRATVDKLDSMLAPWYVATLKRGLPLTFRIHWDGEFFTGRNGEEHYARAWAAAASAYPDVNFWCYTRNMKAAPILAAVPNIAVYASCDQYNVDSWAPVLAACPAIHVAACAESFSAAEQLLARLGRRRAPACPEGVKLPLVVGMSGRGSDVPVPGETGQGACNACGLCIHGRADVRFSTNKKAR